MKRASKCNKMKNFQDLPDELVLKILSYISETKDLISCGQVSKRTRKISHDCTLWMSANLEKKVVKTELLEMILGKGCKILNLCDSTILGSLSSNIKSELRVLNLSQPATWTDAENVKVKVNGNVLGELLFSCCSLHHLVMEGVLVTPKMVVSICKNSKTLQTLNLNFSDHILISSYPYLTEIIKWCQELKEVDLAYVNNNKHWTSGGLTDDELECLIIFHQLLKN